METMRTIMDVLLFVYLLSKSYIYMPKTYTMENKVNTQTAALSEIQTLGHGDPRRNKRFPIQHKT